MIWRLVILACAVAAILLGGLTYLVIWAALAFAVFLLAAALHRGVVPVIVTVEWEHMQRRRTQLEVPDDATSADITTSAVLLAASGRAGRMDEILTDAIGHVGWTAPDGRFGGRAQ